MEISEAMVGGFVGVLVVLLPIAITVYNTIKTRQDKKEDLLKENNTVITTLNITIKSLSQTITELKDDYKKADDKLEVQMNEQGKTLHNHETRISVIEGKV